jgi:hypothetical protein
MRCLRAVLTAANTSSTMGRGARSGERVTLLPPQRRSRTTERHDFTGNEALGPGRFAGSDSGVEVAMSVERALVVGILVLLFLIVLAYAF